MSVLVVRVPFENGTVKAAPSRRHLANPDSVSHSLLPVDADLTAWVLAIPPDELGTLNTDAPKTTGRIKDLPMKRLNNFNYRPDNGGGGEELAAFLALLHAMIRTMSRQRGR